jgi:hypothetical protein
VEYLFKVTSCIIKAYDNSWRANNELEENKFYELFAHVLTLKVKLLTVPTIDCIFTLIEKPADDQRYGLELMARHYRLLLTLFC